MTQTSVFLGKSDKPEALTLKYANRHGLISGATGTGKTVTLQIIAEGLAEAGVPVFVADVKGDLAGLARPVEMKDFLTKRAETVGLAPYEPRGFPVCFWDLFGKQGHPIRTTVSEMGPLLLSRLLDLNETQEGVLTLAFRLADDEGLLLLDLKDLRALLVEVADRAKELSAEYGHVSRASVGAIQRRLLALEEQGAEEFFGEPALDLMDFLRTGENGEGVVNILAADKLMQTPKLYATFLLWLLSELFEELPEIGDPEKPRLVFFFDEAHLLFDDAPDALIDKVEQVVRLIRSKGVGVFFVTQNPLDVPDSVSSQLGNRVQHALRAFTPREQRVVKAAAETFRPNPAFKTLDVITELGIGEALVSTLESKGAPGAVQRTLIRPPASRMGPLTKTERKDVLRYSDMTDKYDEPVDNESAYEILKEKAERRAEAEEKARLKEAKEKAARKTPRRRRRSSRQTVSEAAFKTAARTLARELVRGLLGSLKRR
ncbi:helicase HerA-like domain-containing protein [Hyphococcus luteus]|uniref:ATP-binding protein n=1 Tax=Hyphococcus luteus TaxID=2058213 RepID=A0A2S7K2L6_9PROT|nr:helicase HerA-like domain-containing protein [Marinicaulis flavus]PQA86737.1 ATP-binding protein [Marinicaulis flavus]